MAQIALANVSKCYDTEAALKDVSFSFADQATTAVVGPSGSGKSTLLQLINGLVQPNQGRVLVFGKPIDYGRLVELRRQIGYAVQGTGLFPHLSVEGNDRGRFVQYGPCAEILASPTDEFGPYAGASSGRWLGCYPGAMNDPAFPFDEHESLHREEFSGIPRKPS